MHVNIQLILKNKTTKMSQMLTETINPIFQFSFSVKTQHKTKTTIFLTITCPILLKSLFLCSVIPNWQMLVFRKSIGCCLFILYLAILLMYFRNDFLGGVRYCSHIICNFFFLLFSISLIPVLLHWLPLLRAFAVSGI